MSTVLPVHHNITNSLSINIIHRLVLVILLVLFSAHAFSADQDAAYKKIRIFVPDRQALNRIWETGIDYEGVEGRVGGWMEFVAGSYELLQLSSSQISYEVVVDDLAAYYADILAATPEDASGFGLGSMGGYYTFVEVVQQLDSMRLLYPSLISAKQSIGTTLEGRTIWATRISDNPDTTESGEPEVLYTALHHAREPGGMMTVLYYMWWLLENHGTNAEATYLVNNRQMWFIPVVNPDGYVYNQTTNPSGGGLWRKNRRNNTGSFGVDLNRNYGPYYMWNASNGGSSTSPSSDTYRGLSVFSEQETQSIDFFMRDHNIKACFNYHTYGNYLIYPYGYLSQENSDSVIYRDWAYDMTSTNRYTNGTDQQTVNYSTRGNSDDYMFGDTTKPRTFAMTPEAGPSSFWPPSSQIVSIAAENLAANKYLAFFSGHYPKLRGFEIQGQRSNQSIVSGEPFTIAAEFKNIGLLTANALSVTATASVPWISFDASTVVVDSLPSQETIMVTFDGLADSTAPVAAKFNVYLALSDPDGFSRIDTLVVYLGQEIQLFTDNASAGTSKWTTGTGWGTTSHAHTPPAAFTDSPFGNYSASANNALTMANNVSLANYQFAALHFWTTWAVEPTWDFATVEISTNSGSTWVNLRPTLAHPGSGRSGGKQTTGTWGYDSYSPGVTWMPAFVDLTPYAGQSVKIRFRLSADGGEERDGFYVDDIRVLGYTTTAPPPVPVPIAPADGAIHQPLTPTISWNSSAGATSYHLQVATDSLFTTLVVNDSVLTTTSRQVAALQEQTKHYWRVRARSFAGVSAYSTLWNFLTMEELTGQYTVQESWNLVSLPLNVSDARKSSIFPSSSSLAYAFVNGVGYEPQDTLTIGAGYWLKFDSLQQVSIVGHAVQSDTLAVFTGWNLIGTLTEPVDTSSIVQVPAGIVVSSYLEYDAGYVAADTLVPARGYWVKVSQNGVLILPSPVSSRRNRLQGDHDSLIRPPDRHNRISK